MQDRDAVALASRRIAQAIAARDIVVLRDLVEPDFVHRTHGGPVADLQAFLHAIEQIPGDILSVELEALDIDVCSAGALVTGIQHARVRIDGTVHAERRGFVDLFVKRAGAWRIQAAVDLPQTTGPASSPDTTTEQ